MSRYKAFNIIIALLSFWLIVLGLVFMLAFPVPTTFQETTGIVQDFYQYDEKWYDNIFGNSKGSYFDVRFEDNSYFEATGICYNNIDRRLFEELQIGKELTITYFEKSGGLRKICALEYNGETYLSLNDVLNEYSKNEKTAHIVGPTIMALSISVGALLFVVNYKKNRGK